MHSVSAPPERLHAAAPNHNMHHVKRSCTASAPGPPEAAATPPPPWPCDFQQSLPGAGTVPLPTTACTFPRPPKHCYRRGAVLPRPFLSTPAGFISCFSPAAPSSAAPPCSFFCALPVAPFSAARPRFLLAGPSLPAPGRPFCPSAAALFLAARPRLSTTGAPLPAAFAPRFRLSPAELFPAARLRFLPAAASLPASAPPPRFASEEPFSVGRTRFPDAGGAPRPVPDLPLRSSPAKPF